MIGSEFLASLCAALSLPMSRRASFGATAAPALQPPLIVFATSPWNATSATCTFTFEKVALLACSTWLAAAKSDPSTTKGPPR
jgi:hypothetical protein